MVTVKRVRVMGILNVTPDSFSDGGMCLTREAVSARVEDMIGAGADIIDVGGESSRPFSEPVPLDEELLRVIPAIKAVRAHHSIPISIDTTKAAVAQEAIAAGADIVNDISGLRFDPLMADVIREAGVSVIIMHMKGTPGDMQADPTYDDVMAEIGDFFQERTNWAESKGINRDKIILDPGIGFGKTVTHNLTILKNMTMLHSLGYPILVGHSRKSFIGTVLDLDVDKRDTVTAAISVMCVMNGVSILRVHDVKMTVQAVRMAEAILL